MPDFLLVDALKCSLQIIHIVLNSHRRIHGPRASHSQELTIPQQQSLLCSSFIGYLCTPVASVMQACQTVAWHQVAASQQANTQCCMLELCSILYVYTSRGILSPETGRSAQHCRFFFAISVLLSTMTQCSTMVMANMYMAVPAA
jgi:hypothetical protein